MDKYQHTLIRLIGFLIILLGLTIVGNGSVAAQALNQWSPRQRIPGSHNEARTPYLVADQNQTVHAFHSQPVGENDTERAIFYSHWTIESGWTIPVDVILPPFGRLAVVKGAALDQNGMIHIIFYGGEERNANIYYSRAPVLGADRAPIWSEPEVIGENAIAETAAMAGDGQGNLFVLYASNREGNGLYAVFSTDRGDTWSIPMPVSPTYDGQLFPYLIHLSLDDAGRLHAVWSVNNSTGEGQAIFYTRLEADHATWSNSMALAIAKEEQLDQVTDPAIIAFRDELLVIYNRWPPDGDTIRVMRRSIDHGQTWMQPVVPFASNGEYGSPDFTIDGNEDLHVFFGDRERGLNLWHSIWRGNRWTEPLPVVPPSEALIYKTGPLTFHPWFPNAIVSQGNVILVTWETDRGATLNGTWYSYEIIDSPGLPLMPLPTQTALPAATVLTPTSIPSPTSNPPPDFASELPKNIQSEPVTSPATNLITGILPAALLISVFVLAQVFYHSRRH
jgi:hypothetical protein